MRTRARRANGKRIATVLSKGTKIKESILGGEVFVDWVTDKRYGQ